MTSKIIAIGLDGPNSDQIKRWLEQGKLPNIKAIFDQGASGETVHTKRYRNERCWDIFLSGRDIGSCGSVFLPDSYDYFNESLQREDSYIPFYALNDRYKICMFDLPATIIPSLNGIQISGWGSELNVATPMSQPPDLIAELRSRHGSDPKLEQSIKVYDHKTHDVEYSYVLPATYNLEAVIAFKEKLLTAIARRTDICLDLLARDDWNLFLALYAESHTANHILWHLGEDHPLSAAEYSGNAQLEVLHAIDQSVGRIARALPEHATVVLYTIDHTAANNMDVPSMALLPELLYRWNFPGRQALAVGALGHPVPAMRSDYRRHWKQEVWSLATDEGRQQLVSPSQLETEGNPMSWNPATWYRPQWQHMRAFALPSVSDGYVRLNVKGREANGIVPTQEFALELAQITRLLERATNPRTGRPMVKQIITTRSEPGDSPAIPPDLIVCWNDQFPADVLDSPDCGRIGPLPYFRSGGHVAHGTVVENVFAVCGPGIAPGVKTRRGNLEDLPATILDLLGVALPSNMTGASLLNAHESTPSNTTVRV